MAQHNFDSFLSTWAGGTLRFKLRYLVFDRQLTVLVNMTCDWLIVIECSTLVEFIAQNFTTILYYKQASLHRRQCL